MHRARGVHMEFKPFQLGLRVEHPQPLIDQLAVGGRLVIPVGPTGKTQELQVLEKQADGTLKRERVLPVRFVPLTGPGASKEPG